MRDENELVLWQPAGESLGEENAFPAMNAGNLLAKRDSDRFGLTKACDCSAIELDASAEKSASTRSGQPDAAMADESVGLFEGESVRSDQRIRSDASAGVHDGAWSQSFLSRTEPATQQAEPASANSAQSSLLDQQRRIDRAEKPAGHFFEVGATLANGAAVAGMGSAGEEVRYTSTVFVDPQARPGQSKATAATQTLANLEPPSHRVNDTAFGEREIVTGIGEKDSGASSLIGQKSSLEKTVSPGAAHDLPAGSAVAVDGVKRIASLSEENLIRLGAAWAKDLDGCGETGVSSNLDTPDLPAISRDLPAISGARLVKGPPVPTFQSAPSACADQFGTAPTGTVNVDLAPAELGRLRISFGSSDAGLGVTLHAERSETLELMRRHIDQLSQDLRELGYDNISFDFGGSRHGAGEDPSWAGDGAIIRAEMEGSTPSEPSEFFGNGHSGDASLDLRL